MNRISVSLFLWLDMYVLTVSPCNEQFSPVSQGTSSASLGYVSRTGFTWLKKGLYILHLFFAELFSKTVISI